MRPLKEAYFSVVIDACFLSLRRGSYKKEPIYIALGTDHEGRREILGFWVMGAEGESAHAWREIFSELKERGMERIDIVVTGDLPGIEEATRTVFPGADRKLCLSACHAQLPEEDKKEGLGGGISRPQGPLSCTEPKRSGAFPLLLRGALEETLS